MHSLAALPRRWPLRLSITLLTTVLVVGASAPVLGVAQPAPPAQPDLVALPDGFVDELVISDLNDPTQVEFASDGRVFVAEKSGIIKVFSDVTDATPTVFADLRTQTHNYWDRGLLGLELHPQFPAVPKVYALYTHDAVIGGTAPRWGAAGQSGDGCPNPPGATSDGCVVSGRLSALTASGNTSSGQSVLIEDWCQQFPSHSVGDLAFGPDGALYVSGGDGANFNIVDYGQDGDPLNPCGDPPVGPGGTQTPPGAQGGALRSLDLLSSGDPVTLDGTIVRINADTGAGLTGNPLSGSSDANARRIIAMGLRNPFRMAFRPGTSELWVGDVGWGTWEEVNRIADTTPSSVVNFGWPCYEGSARQSAYDNTNLSMCETLYGTPSAVTAPHFAYRHDLDLAPPDDCPPAAPPAQVSSSITSLAFYDGSAFPSEYHGALFGADYSRGCIWVMLPDGSGVPQPSTIQAFQPSAESPVDIQMGPDGALYYVNLSGEIRRLRSTSNLPPTAALTASTMTGPAPLEVLFDARDSVDPEGGTLAYSWDLDDDAQFDDGSASTVTFTYTTAGQHRARVRVTDDAGGSDIAQVFIQVDNSLPTVEITAPSTSLRWKVGDVVTFRGTATDPQDGDISAQLDWSLALHHCAGTTCHVHPLTTFSNRASGSFDAPDHEYPSYLELTARVSDASGGTASAVRRIDPATVDLRFATMPSGLQLSVGGTELATTPFTRRVIVGSRNSLGAPSSQSLGGTTYVFESWSDGGAAGHQITAPSSATTYTATYAPSDGSSPSVGRLAGADRYSTAVEVSKWRFPGAGPRNVAAAYISTGTTFPDALAAVPAAHRRGGPILLVRPNEIPTVVRAELARLDPAHIYVLGGTAAISEAVRAQLASYSDSGTTRLGGVNRYATAALVATNAFPGAQAEVFVTTGANFPDALAGGAAAAARNRPILLVTGTGVPSQTVAALNAMDPDKIWILGGPAAISTAVENQLEAIAPTQRLAGANRYATATVVSDTLFSSAVDHAFVATGLSFPDALSAGAAGDPVLLTTPTSLPAGVGASIQRLTPSSLHVVGGIAVVSNAVLNQLRVL